MIKIHVDTEALQKSQPAIIVAPPNAPALPQTRLVTLCCPACGAKTATVEQHGTNAHVVVPRRVSIVCESESSEGES